MFHKLPSKHLRWNLLLVKFYAFSYSSEHLYTDASEVLKLFFEKHPIFDILNYLKTAKASLQKLFDRNTLKMNATSPI